MRPVARYPTVRDCRSLRRAAVLVLAVGVAIGGCGSSSRVRSSASTATSSASSGGASGAAASTSTSGATTTSRPSTSDTATSEAPTSSTAPSTTSSRPSPTVPSPTTRASVSPTSGATAAPAAATPTSQPAVASTAVAAAPASAGGSDVPWGWIALGAAVVVAVAAVLIGRNRRKHRTGMNAWRADAASALERARIARDVLVGSETRDREATRAVGQQVEAAARRLDTVAGHAHTDDDRLAAAATAGALRDLFFALEADELVRNGVAPTAEQLARAGRDRAERATALDRAIERLEARVGVRAASTGV